MPNIQISYERYFFKAIARKMKSRSFYNLNIIYYENIIKVA